MHTSIDKTPLNLASVWLLMPIVMMLSVSIARAQGTIRLSNVGLQGRVIGFFPGAIEVSFAVPDGTLVGKSTSVFPGGFFSGGTQSLDGLTGDVTLTVAGWRSDAPHLLALSDPFTVSLGESLETPAVIPADFSGILVPPIPEPSVLALSTLGVYILFNRLNSITKNQS